MQVFAYDGIFQGAPILHEMAHPFHRHHGSGNNGNVKSSLSPKNKTPAKQQIKFKRWTTDTRQMTFLSLAGRPRHAMRWMQRMLRWISPERAERHLWQAKVGFHGNRQQHAWVEKSWKHVWASPLVIGLHFRVWCANQWLLTVFKPRWLGIRFLSGNSSLKRLWN